MRHRDMPRKPASIRLRAPQLDDEAVVEIHGFLEDVLHRFESRYGAQLRRFYDDRDQRNLAQYKLNLDHASDNDSPF